MRESKPLRTAFGVAMLLVTGAVALTALGGDDFTVAPRAAGNVRIQSTGGDFELMGRIDPDTGPILSGGAYTLAGAVWTEQEPPSSSALATLTGLDVTDEALQEGGVRALVKSDDVYLHARSGTDATSVDPNSLEMILRAETKVSSPSTLAITIESRISEPSGMAEVFLKNWMTGTFDRVAQYAIGVMERTHTSEDIDAANYVSESGEIELSIRHGVEVPFFAFTFESFIDQVEIIVRQ